MSMDYKSSDIEAFKDIWVFLEQRDGKLAETDFELLSEGRKLADERGVRLVGLLLGSQVRALASQAGGYGADHVIICEAPQLSVYTTDAYAKVVCDVVREKKPEVLLIGASNIGRDLAPRCAARLHTGLTADCTHLDIDMKKYVDFLERSSTLDVSETRFDMDDTNLKMTRPAFGGHLMATIICPKYRPCMSTVRPGVFARAAYDEEAAARCTVEVYPAALSDADLKTKVLEVVREAKETADLTGAEVIVSVGRGIGKDVEKGLRLAGELAEAFGGGVVGGSRAAVDSGWLTQDHQVGQTGRTVRPRIYVALGISGAIQHVAGMQDAECIIAVNKNAAAPIFDVADYGIAGDLFQVVPMLIDELKAVS